MTQEQPVTLDTIGGGSLRELFAAELTRVLQNIADPNTDDEAVREITIKVKLKPNRDRNQTKTVLSCTSKLAGIRTVETNLFIGVVRGKLMAVENDPKQITLFQQAPPLSAVSNVTPINPPNQGERQ